MSDRTERRPKPRIQPRMNTETKRHEEKAMVHRKAKYRDDPMDDEELTWDPNEVDGGVLSDYADEPADEPAEEAPQPAPPARRKRR